MTTPDPDESGSNPPDPGAREAWIPEREQPTGAETWVPLTDPPPQAADPAQRAVIPDPTPYAMPDPTPDLPQGAPRPPSAPPPPPAAPPPKRPPPKPPAPAPVGEPVTPPLAPAAPAPGPVTPPLGPAEPAPGPVTPPLGPAEPAPGPVIPPLGTAEPAPWPGGPAVGRTPPPYWSTPETRASLPPIGGPPEPPPVWEGEPGVWSTEPPPYQAPGQPPRRDQRVWLILGVVAILLSCCCVVAGLIALTWGREISDSVRNQQVIGLNQTARDGDLEFRVRGVRCGIGRVGDPLISQSAVGQFCLVEMTIRNVGRRPAVFADTLQKAFGASGEQFVADATAGLLANADQRAFLADINPGNLVHGALVYDVPRDARVVRVELHRSAGSPGVIVRTG